MSLFKNNSFIIRFERDYFNYLIYLYAFLLPLPNNLKSIALIALASLWLLSIASGNYQVKKIFSSKVFWSFIILYLLCIFSIFRSENKKDALDFIILQSSLPLLPLFLFRKLNSIQVKTANICFTTGAFVVSVFAVFQTYTIYFDAFEVTLRNIKALDWAYFSYILPISIGFHAPYFSLYMCAGLLIILQALIESIIKKERVKIFSFLIVAAYFIIFIFLLSSRTALFATFGVCTTLVSIKLIKQRKIALTAIIAVSIIGLTVTSLKYVPYLYNKISSSAGTTERVILWTSAVEVIKESPIFGVGTGDRKVALIAQYKRAKFMTGIESELNVHNQYLDIAVSMGLLGLLALILCFASVANFAIMQHNPVLLAFILIFSLSCFTESLLHRQAGVVLFSYFCAIFVFAPKRDEEIR